MVLSELEQCFTRRPDVIPPAAVCVKARRGRGLVIEGLRDDSLPQILVRDAACDAQTFTRRPRINSHTTGKSAPCTAWPSPLPPARHEVGGIPCVFSAEHEAAASKTCMNRPSRSADCGTSFRSATAASAARLSPLRGELSAALTATVVEARRPTTRRAMALRCVDALARGLPFAFSGRVYTRRRRASGDR